MSELRLRRYYGYKKTRVSTKKMLRTIWEFGSSNNDRFLGVNMIFFFTKKQPNSLTFFILISHVFDPPVVECYASYYTSFISLTFCFMSLLLFIFISIQNVSMVFFSETTLDVDNQMIRTLWYVPLVPVLTWFHCILLFNVLLLLLE